MAFFFEKIKFSVIYNMEEDKNLHDLKGEFVEDMANAIENDEIRNDDPLEELEEANGKEQESEASEEPNLDELEYADGKERDELDLIEEQEKIFGTNMLSPFKTADMRIFRRNLETMTRDQMSSMAERTACRIYSNEQEQKEELTRGFVDWCKMNAGAFQTDASKKAEKGARAKAFEDSVSVKELEEKLKSKSLSDIQSTAARLGFNPGFDKNRLINLIKQEYQRQS